MSRRFRSLLVALTATAGLLAAATAAGQPVAHTAGGCGVGSGRGYGYTYLTSLSVHRTSCSTGKKVVRHHGHLGGWHCSKTRLATSPVQYDERESCKSGGRRVVWTYTQNK
jgi:hypothetical protein